MGTNRYNIPTMYVCNIIIIYSYIYIYTIAFCLPNRLISVILFHTHTHTHTTHAPTQEYKCGGGVL